MTSGQWVGGLWGEFGGVKEEPPLVQCDACDRLVPVDEIESMIVVGAEGGFCQRCRHAPAEHLSKLRRRDIDAHRANR